MLPEEETIERYKAICEKIARKQPLTGAERGFLSKQASHARNDLERLVVFANWAPERTQRRVFTKESLKPLIQGLLIKGEKVKSVRRLHIAAMMIHDAELMAGRHLPDEFKEMLHWQIPRSTVIKLASQFLSKKPKL